MWEEDFFQLSAAAARQQGMVTQAQGARVGVGAAGFDHLKDVGLLLTLDWDVYQVAGSSVTSLRVAYPYAGWLAFSPDLFAWERPPLHDDAVLSHESACSLYGLPAVSVPRMVLTVPQEQERTPPRATRIHVAHLTPEEVTVHEGVPVTTPHRTILDLLGWCEQIRLGRVITEAVRLDLVDLAELHADLAPLAADHHLPIDGSEFLDHLAPGLRPEHLSTRNLRAYTMLRSPDRVAAVRHDVLPSTGEGQLSWDIAAEIVARVAQRDQLG